LRTEPFQHHEAVAGRQTQVEDDGVGLLFASFAHRRKRINGEAGLVAVRPQQHVISEANIGIIFDDENL
jgi:hypothetical protein